MIILFCRKHHFEHFRTRPSRVNEPNSEKETLNWLQRKREKKLRKNIKMKYKKQKMIKKRRSCPNRKTVSSRDTMVLNFWEILNNYCIILRKLCKTNQANCWKPGLCIRLVFLKQLIAEIQTFTLSRNIHKAIIYVNSCLSEIFEWLMRLLSGLIFLAILGFMPRKNKNNEKDEIKLGLYFRPVSWCTRSVILFQNWRLIVFFYFR